MRTVENIPLPSSALYSPIEHMPSDNSYQTFPCISSYLESPAQETSSRRWAKASFHLDCYFLVFFVKLIDGWIFWLNRLLDTLCSGQDVDFTPGRKNSLNAHSGISLVPNERGLLCARPVIQPSKPIMLKKCSQMKPTRLLNGGSLSMHLLHMELRGSNDAPI